MNKSSLADRMKKYEGSTNYNIISRVPIIARLDGKKFSSLTKKLNIEKPFSSLFSAMMTQSAIAVASEMQGCMLGYTQSDEITFVIRTDQSDETTPWFDNRIQKMVSVSASIATAAFNRILWESFKFNLVNEKIPKAHFDCRVFPVPSMTEVVNNLIWRQRDCIKNSISSAAYFEIGRKCGRGTTRKMVHKLNQNERQELLFQETGMDWNSYPGEFKNGIVIFRASKTITTTNGTAIRKKWDSSPAPIFTSDDGRNWLNLVLNIQEDESND